MSGWVNHAIETIDADFQRSIPISSGSICLRWTMCRSTSRMNPGRWRATASGNGSMNTAPT